MVIIWKVILLSAIGSFGLLGNILACITLLKNPKVMGQSQTFILNQSLLDAIASVMLFLSDINLNAAGYTIYYQDNWAYSMLCKTWSTGGLLWGFMTASTYSLVFLTLDRFLKIRHPFWSRKYYTTAVVKVFLILPWIIGPVFQIGMQINASKVIHSHCTMTMVFDTLGKITALVICAVEFYLPLLLIIGCYCGIIHTVKKQRGAMKKYNTDQTVHSISETVKTAETSVHDTVGPMAANTLVISDKLDQSQNRIAENDDITKVNQREANLESVTEGNYHETSKANHAERKLTAIVAVVCGGFFLCYIMSQIMFLLDIAGLFTMSFSLFDVAQILGFANCAINPIIYVLMHDKLRKAFLCSCCFKRNRFETASNTKTFISSPFG